MMDSQVPLSELKAYQLRRQLIEVGSGSELLTGIDPDASVFIRDFKAISHSLNDKLEGRPPKPHGIAMFPPFRKTVVRQSLPFGPLRRMARRVGIDELRYLFEVGSDKAMDPFRLIIRPRLDKEFSRGNHYKRYDQRADKIEFGNRVLELERDKSGCEKFGRTEALELAAAECGLKAASTITEQRVAFGRILADAPRLPMGEIAPLVRRPVIIDPDEIYTEIGVRSFYRGLFERRQVLGSDFEWQKLFRIEYGDLVFSNLMAWEQAIALAQSKHAGAVGNHRMLMCQADRTRILPEFLYYYFTTDEGHREVLKASPGTMVRNKTLSTKLLPLISVPVPPLDAQRRIVDLFAKARAAKAAQAEAKAHLDQLLPAMLGEVFG